MLADQLNPRTFATLSREVAVPERVARRHPILFVESNKGSDIYPDIYPARQTESPAIIVGLQRITTSLWFMSLRYRNVYRSIVTGLKVEL